MNLREFEGKRMFRRYGISIPRAALWHASQTPFRPWMDAGVVLKAQVRVGDRKRVGGIRFAKGITEIRRISRALFKKIIAGEPVSSVLVEERLRPASELYISFSYDTASRGPVFSFSPRGGSGIAGAHVFPIDLSAGVEDFFIRDALLRAGGARSDIGALSKIARKLWNLFWNESALLAEINPLFRLPSGAFVAGDAKIIIDDEAVLPGKRRLIRLPGDIAILASGGGASLLSIDALVRAGGRPANYTEYSGNPPASVVSALTKKVLSQKGVRGCWVVGGTANFTDIYETLSGFVAGLRDVKPKPRYPIVIRRDGPRQGEAFRMLSDVAKKHRYDFHLFGAETPIQESARVMVECAYSKKERPRR